MIPAYYIQIHAEYLNDEDVFKFKTLANINRDHGKYFAFRFATDTHRIKLIDSNLLGISDIFVSPIDFRLCIKLFIINSDMLVEHLKQIVNRHVEAKSGGLGEKSLDRL